ncbi:hypothetical protein BHE74_00034929 [Ensete ventricosum]|nr:hypothetical protein GW17_00052955 [Ensete ventricosum]RWW58225.1 hypothetical protein BHE74_00034929 [Ensete ventricosum]RZR82958.1 hypothetical protein BHM03_00009498 [Ensete ventricosum]
MITFAIVEIYSEDKMEKILRYVKIRTCNSTRCGWWNFMRSLIQMQEGNDRLIDLRLGVEDGGDILKQLWELFGWVEVAEMAAGVARTWIPYDKKDVLLG